MYSSEFQESLKAVEAAREENIKYEPTGIFMMLFDMMKRETRL